ncbi:unnamed protein product, partial [Sphenostylis stenocarpa]
MILGLASAEGNTSFGGVNQSENGNNLRRKRKGKNGSWCKLGSRCDVGVIRNFVENDGKWQTLIGSYRASYWGTILVI